MNIKALFCLTLFFTPSFLTAQDIPKKSKNYFIAAELQILKTTHSNFFKGGNLVVGRALSPKFYLGAGVEYAYAYYHNDNG